MVSPAVSRTLRWMAGIQDDEQPEQQQEPSYAAPFQDTYEPPVPAPSPARDDYRLPEPTPAPPVAPDGGSADVSLAAPPTSMPEQPAGDQSWVQRAIQGLPTLGDVGSGLASAASSISDAYAAPRPPQYSGPSYAQPSVPEGQAPPVVSTVTTAAEVAKRAGTGLWEAAKDPQNALDTVTAAGHRAVDAGLEAAATSPWVADIGSGAGSLLTPPKMPTTPSEVLEAAEWLRRRMDPLAPYNDIIDGARTAFGDEIGRRVAAAAGAPESEIANVFGRSITGQDVGGFIGSNLLDPSNYLAPGATQAGVRAAAPAVREGVEQVRGAARVGADRFGAVRAANAERMAAADARMAAEGSTAAPGVFGLSGIEPGRPEVQGMRPRIIPPDVADQLDIPLRLPEDPAVVRAIEAAGGTVDERGTTLNVIRMSDPEAAGGAATRSMVFYTAGPPGAPSEYARTGTVGPQGVGGQQRIEGRTRFRNPLFISDAPGEARGFDDAMRQMGAVEHPNVVTAQQDMRAAQGVLQAAEERASQDFAAARTSNPIVTLMGWQQTPQGLASRQAMVVAYDAVEEASRRLARAQMEHPLASAASVEEGIAAAKRAGPAGSPERAAALKDLVTRYGGDPDTIDDLIALRGADMGESVYAVKENIVAGNARRAGHDGVITLKQGIPDYAAINEHPAVVAANQALGEANAAERAARQQYDVWKSRLRQHGQGPRDATDEGWAHLQRLAQDEGRRSPTEAEWVSENTLAQAQRRAQEASAATFEASRQARAELTPREITELADPRELRNPTPGGPNPRIEEVRRGLEAAQDRESDLQRALDAEFRRQAPGAEPSPEWQRLSAERDAAHEAVYRWYDELTAQQRQPVGPPGYTLRPDIPRRQQSFAELEQAYKALQQRAAVSATAAEGEALLAEMKQMEPRLMEALQRERGTTAQASAGALPAAERVGADRFGAVRSDPLAGVNRALSQGVVSSVSGGVGAQVNQELNPDDPYAGLKGFAAGALAPPLIARGARTAARLAGAAPSPGGSRGALATFGTPGAGGAPSGIGQRIATAYQQHKAANVATMQAAGITRPSALGLAAQVPGAISHAALLGPATATIGVMSGLVDAAKAPLKEVVRAGVRAGQTGSASAWREAGETFKGAAAAFYGHEHVGRQLWDVIRGQGRYASLPDRPRLAEQISEPILRTLVGALEVPGRVWSSGPDAIFGTIGRKGAQFREAAQMATDRGLSGGAWGQEVNRVLGEYEQAARTGAAQSADGARLEAVGQRAAERAGYQEELGRVGKIGRSVATLGEAPVIGQFVSPYYNTPWNQFIRAGESLPTGVLMGRAGDPTLPSSVAGGGGRHTFDRVFDATLGSALVAGGLAYGMSGKITGSGPADPDERKMLRATGWRPYSYLVEDTYLPNRSAGQYEPILNAIGETSDWMRYRKPEADQRMVGEDAFRRIGKLLSEAPFASGLKTVMDMVDYGPAALASDVATRVTPGAAIGRAVGQSTDPYERTVDRGKGVGFWDEVGQRWQLATGQREGLPIQQDPAGRAVPNPREGLAAFFPQVGTKREDPLISAFTEAGLTLSGPPPTVEGVQLTPEQQRRYHTLFGEMLEQTAGPLVRSEGWASIPVPQRKTLLEQMSQVARTTAAAQTQGEGGADYWRDYTKVLLERAGVTP